MYENVIMEDADQHQTDAPQDGEAVMKVVSAFSFHPVSRKFRVLDQTLLPAKVKYLPIDGIESGRRAIRKMIVRGAPCIAAVGCLSIIKELYKDKFVKNPARNVNTLYLVEWLKEQAAIMHRDRPTAVNLKNALNALIDFAEKNFHECETNLEFVTKLRDFCLDAVRAGVLENRKLGDHGAEELLRKSGKDKVRILTHCNTGTLATVGYGTALGVIRTLYSQKALDHVFCTETRPYNQGSRLTAWELVTEGIPSTLITDSMASYLMHTVPMDAVLVGADCVCADGSVANKIGTLQLAITAKHFNVPFYVAAPTQSFDLNRSGEDHIPIEERPQKELRNFGSVQLAPLGIGTWNPAFDVTPPDLITAIITEVGVCLPKDVKSFIIEQEKAGPKRKALF